ncbi:hypothetical protein X760_27750 [Mesorhizobium sp. LSHC422A00]|uniref:hypothetical protein n=1 Tax=Mesorhizobium sp. LSHC422A00 TaxID=1287294 RepID=UPI0003CE65AF|nr:hypothetical protein [Mesorhizobium sp. LSHC422A00]ESX54720.1 hypothetical protein X760_27750 [Mesorhizobium sp. LSHC422A00]
MPQVDLQAIKDSLPEWPDDVIEQWLLPFAKDLGWPPPVPLGEHRWHYILAKKPLSWWQGLKWELRDIDLQNPTYPHVIGIWQSR